MLVVVDMVNGFIKEGQLSDKGISHITDEIVRLINLFKNENMPIIAFRDCHCEDAPELSDFPKHCLKGSYESEFIDEIKFYENDFLIFDKNCTDGFMAPGFVDYMKSMPEISEIVIVGCCTDICVMNIATSLKNFYNQMNEKVRIIVPQNAVETYDIPHVHARPYWSDVAFRFMRQAGVEVIEGYNF